MRKYTFASVVALACAGLIIAATPDHSTVMNTGGNQMYITTTDNTIKYYNTAELESVDIDKVSGKVTVTPKGADWTDEYLKNVSAISFAKSVPTGPDGTITNRGVTITEAKGWLESVYMKWDPVRDATSYNVYVRGGKYSDYTPVDRELVRDYGTYCRVDLPGLPAGTYSLKVAPVIGGNEVMTSASEATDMTVIAHDRSGFAFHGGDATATYDGSGIGAYKANGELKDNARVIYVTAETAKSVTCLVKQSNKDGDGTEFTGLQAILTAYQKGLETRPLAVRIIGTIRDTDLDRMDSSAEGLQIKGKNKYSPVHITIEGIGEDATTWGFGFLIRNCSSVELRNFANMLCMDDCLSFDTANAHCWVHHMDFFYGKPGSDSDQAKGDGTVDIKSDSKYITVAYNHFWDNGKTSLCGMKSETGPNYIDYHHNWFDHSDSRHPRIRTMSVHVWNNYYDGVAKYGVGAAMQSCAFVENNFFRNSKNPMLISRQGTDISSDAKGTFSGEDGGIIKSYGNLYAETADSKQRIPVTFASNGTEFDCYEASSRDEKVPETVKAKQGGKTYDNFDTDPDLMHTYTPIPAADVPAVVTGYYGAGRLNKGDFKWTFDNATEDSNYGVITGLKNALLNYESPLNNTGTHRTVLVYMVADNTLGTSYGSDQDDLNEMIKGAKAGSLNGGRLLVYHNRPKTSSGNPPQMLEITEEGIKVLKTYPDDPLIYSVDPERITEVMADMKELAPAEDYGLVLWSHANGWLGGTSENDTRYRAFGDDRGYHITVQTLAKTLEGEKFSFVYFDCCLMGCVEVIYELRNIAPIMVATPTELGIDGMPYDRNMPYMFSQNSDMGNAMTLAAETTYNYYEANENGYADGCQIAVYDTRHLETLANVSRNIFKTVTLIDTDATKIQCYNTPYSSKYMYDMDNLMEILVSTSNSDLLEAWRTALRNVLVFGKATRNGIGGICIDRFCGLGTYVIDQKSDITWRQYNTLQWWNDVVSYAPAYN